MKIRTLTARPILDSRGMWTVETTLELANGVRATASVPQGKSVGSAEARPLPAPIAARKINNVIAPKLKRVNLHASRDGTAGGRNEQAALDALLIRLDGTGFKSNLGANAILATSIAFARASAETNNVPLWKYIRDIYGVPVHASRDLAHPRLFINVINGGLHAGNNLDFQEYLIIPKCSTIRKSVDIGTQVYHALGETLARAKGKTATNIGDEGGYAPNFKDDLEPFRILRMVVKKLKLVKKVDFGMDAAATDIKKVRHKELESVYVKLLREEDFIYLEDPFNEEDFLSFAALTMHYGAGSAERARGGGRGMRGTHGKDRAPRWIAGDDLTTTNAHRMERAHAENSVNAVIVKPNQIGTVSEALDAVRTARKYGWAVVASHRSGETNDDFIADFAYGVGADGLKLGAPARGERIAKYNRLLEIEAGETHSY